MHDDLAMAKSIQIRNVPNAVHKRLSMLGAKAGKSLSEYLLGELTAHAAMPTPEEMRERLRARQPVKLAESAAAAVRKERDSA